MACPNTGNGTTIAFSVNAWAGRINIVNGLEEEKDVLEDDDIATTGHMQYCEGDLIRISPLTVETWFDPSDVPQFAGPETITIKYPSGYELTGTGFVNARTGGTCQNNERMAGSFSIQFDGATGPIYQATAP